MTQQDDYYYEIQLTNKQLVFYFLAGALGLVLAFLVGVMVGRGVDNSAPGDTQTAKAVTEERIVPEEPVASPSAEPSVEELTYARRLEADRAEEVLERPRPGARGSAPPASRPASPPTAAPLAAATASPVARPTPTPVPRPAATPTPRAVPTPRPTPTPKATAAPPAKAAASPVASAAPAPAGSFSIQVGAFSSRDAAEAIVARLKKKGYEAFVVTPSAGLFNVRVGRYEARADAERTQAKLRDEEKFKPFIVRN